MAGAQWDPQIEQRLREDVIYLHSLWHQGPRTLAPSKTTLFKRGGGDRREKKMGKDIANISAADTTEWPCPAPTPPPSHEGWPTFDSESKAKAAEAHLLSPEEQLKLASRNAHRSAQKVVNDFFYSDATDSDSYSDSDDELMVDDDHGQERDYDSFFFKVFEESAELRECYKNNFFDGEFTCLVCSASRGKKMSKKYRGCLALVQHSITIAKTKKRRAHRALGQAICKVLGWDIDQLPSIVSSLSDKSCEAEVNVSAANGGAVAAVMDNVDSVEQEGDKLDSKNGNAVVVGSAASVEDDKLVNTNTEAALEGGSNDAGVLPCGDEVNMSSLSCPDAGKDLDDPSMVVHPNCMEIPALEKLTSVCNSLTSPDADRDTENPHDTHALDAEQLAMKELTNASIMTDDSENYNLNPDSVEVPAADGLTSLSLVPIKIPGVGNECKNW